MKKLSLLTAACLISLSLMGCNNANQEDEEIGNNEQSQAENVENEGTNGDNLEESNTNNGDDTRFEVADEAAEKITELEEVESATVIVTNHNAYVAAVLNDETQEDVPDDVKAKIADEVKAVDKDINDVFVSVNPDFVEQTDDFADRADQGEPVEGLIEEFNEVVERVFPEAE